MFSLLSLFLCFSALLSALHAEEDDHAHEVHWEWAGLFKVSSSESTRHTFELRNLGEEDPVTFRAGVVIVASTGEDEESFEVAEEAADILFEAAEDSATLAKGSHVELEVNHVYALAYSNESWLTAVTIQFPSDGYYVMFTEHHPTELCGLEDYYSCFRDHTGAQISMLLEEGGEHEDHEDHEENHEDDLSVQGRWLYSMLGCFLCWVVVFSGLLLVVCGTQQYQHFAKSYLHLLNLFASGAILATVLFLILIEAYHFIDANGAFTEPQVAGVYGSAILAGFISPTLIELLVFQEEVIPNDVISNQIVEMVDETKMAISTKPAEVPMQHVAAKKVLLCDEEEADLTSFSEENKTPNVQSQDQTNPDSDLYAEKNTRAPQVTSSTFQKQKLPMNSVVISILCGDFLHNFCDGVFIGVAVRSCSLSLVWAIVFATMFHEFAQEISDFVILTNKVGLSIPHALTLNAIGGFSVVLGGILTNVWDLSDLLIGIFLAFGSGNLMYLSVAELYPLLHIPPEGKTKLTKWDKLQGVLCFCFGAFVIGLTLLKHEHCEASGDEGHGEH